VVLALIAIVLAVLVWSDRSTESDPPAEVAQVVEDYINAITNQDVDAWRATITDEYILRRSVYSPETQTRWEQDSYLEDTADPYAFRIEFNAPVEYEQLDDSLVTGDGPWYVTIRQRWIEIVEPDQIVWEGNGTFVVVERDGVMKVDAEYWAGTMDSLED
jgi:hypothetical protein